MSDKLRLRFTKNQRSIYISHLDLLHDMQRAFVRAGYHVKHSEGFNPHPITSILIPLPLGMASECELMDFRLVEEEEIESEEMVSRLNHAFPEGIIIQEVYVPERKAIELKWIEVEGRMEYDVGGAGEMANKLNEYYSSSQITVRKKTKHGEADVDLIPMIKSISFIADTDQKVTVRAMLSAQEPTMNPDLLIKALEQNKPELSPDFAQFTRKETYDAEGKVYR